MTAPDTANKYPSEELMTEWVHQPYGRAAYSEVIRKACDWQREQDALICESRKDRFGGADYHEACDDCATAIRHPQAPNATEGGK